MENHKKRIVFDVKQELHQTIKILAARRNISMSLWLSRAIADRIDKETKHDIKND